MHRSYVDWIVVARITRRRLRYITKDSVWKAKWLGRFIELLGAFPVHRGSADREAFNRCVEVLEGGEPLVLFPEGTRRGGPVLLPILDGAAYLALKAGVPIVPVGVGGSERRMPKGSKFPTPGRISIVIGEPIDPSVWLKGGKERDKEAGTEAGKEAGHAGEAGAGGPRRISRSATRDLSAVVRYEVQRCFDKAQQRLGLAAASEAEVAAAGIGLPGTRLLQDPSTGAATFLSANPPEGDADAAAAPAADEGN